jgi:lipoprotein-anchoring transpeptidase ErfK/SrfK
VREVVEGPDGNPWYKIQDELDTGLNYCIPGSYMRPITPEELMPIHPDVDPWSKRIEVSIARQTLKAYEGDKVVLETLVSTGLPRGLIAPGEISTKTPSGNWNVQTKMPSKHMGNGHPTSDPEAYELPGVPWCSFFVPDIGVAFHGTFWHLNYGNPMSHGCVNMRPEESKWLFNWTTPVYQFGKRDVRGFGTPVIVS